PENRKEHRKNKQVLYGDTYPHSRRFKKLLGRLSPRVQLSGTPLWQTGGTPPSLKRTPSASSAERTRFKARALALGTLPLEPSQAVRQGREIEARSASSCVCQASETARCAQHAARDSCNRHVEIFYAASARVNVSVLYQFVDTIKRPWPTSVAPRRGFIPVGQRVARSLPERWPAVLPRETWFLIWRFKAIGSRTEEGAALGAGPF